MKRMLIQMAVIAAVALTDLVAVAGINEPPCTPPSVTSQPASQAKCLGDGALFALRASGTTPLSYQWQRYVGDTWVDLVNGGTVSGATFNNLIISAVVLDDQTSYRAVVNNACSGNGVISQSADLSVGAMPAPGGCVSWWQGEGNGADVYGLNPGIVSGSGITFAPGQEGQAFTFNGVGPVRIPASPSLNVGAEGAFTIEAWVNPANFSTAQPILEWNWDGTTGVALWALAGEDVSTLVADIVDDARIDHLVFAWYSLAMGVFQHVVLVYDPTDSSLPARLYLNGALVGSAGWPVRVPALTTGDLYLGFSPNDEQFLGTGTQFSGQLDEVALYNRAHSDAEIGQLYAAAGHKCGIAPTVITPPGNQTANAGNTVELRVLASGTSLTYQWFFNSVAIGSATGPVLKLTNVQVNQAGTYCVTVGNAWGSVGSYAMLTVNPVANGTPRPTINTQPASQTTACQGGAFSLSVAATGSGSLRYQWCKNGVNINGATASSYTCSQASTTDAGTYNVIVYDSVGQVSSADAAAAVPQRPTAVLSGDATVAAGLPTTIRALLTGARPWTLTWHRVAGLGAGSDLVETGVEDSPHSLVVAPASTTTYTLTSVVDANDCHAIAADITGHATVTVAGPSDQPPTVTISTPTGTSLLASDDLVVLAEASDVDGTIARIQILRDGVPVADTTASPLQYTLTKVGAGTYSFWAEAMDDAGFVSVSSPLAVTATAPGPTVSLVGKQPLFTSSPGTLLAKVVGVNPGTLTSLTLNGVPVALTTGSFSLSAALSAGPNTFTLIATDNQGRSGQATAAVQLDSAAPSLKVTAWKTSCEDKSYFSVTDLAGSALTGGRFDLLVYFDGVNGTDVGSLQRWGPTDVLESGGSHLFWFCSTDHSITDFDCSIAYQGSGGGAASPKFRIAVRDNTALLKNNTTQIRNPNRECDHQDGSEYLAPVRRLECDPDGGVAWCAPDPCGPWPQPLPTHSPAGDATPQLDNFYKDSDPPASVGVGCPKNGFKNIYAAKVWQGAWGPKSSMWRPIAAMNGDGSCPTPAPPRNTPDGTKYLTLNATCTGTYNHYYFGEEDHWNATSSSSCSVGRYTGRLTGSGSDTASEGADPDFVRTVRACLGHANDNVATLVGLYVQLITEWSLNIPSGITYSGQSTTPSASYEYLDEWTHVVWSVTLDIAGGSIDASYASLSGDGWAENTQTITVRLGSDSIYYGEVSRDHDSGGNHVNDYTYEVHATFGVPYTSANVNADTDTLLATWNLLDDIEYPWRTDGGITRGPFVTYNECGGAPRILGPGPFQDPNPLPWPSQPPGAVLGAPLPVHGPNGELYSYGPYFNFYHINRRFAESERGHPQGFIASRGAASPFPNATQWLDDDQARCFPGGPFWAYGSEVEGIIPWGHSMFRFKEVPQRFQWNKCRLRA